MEKFVGIEIGGTKLQLVTGGIAANIIDRVRYSIDPTAGGDRIREQIKEGIERLLSHYKISAIGIGFGGPVDWQTGIIQLSHQVDGWGNFNLKAWLEQLTGIPVAIDNDANTAALAEAKYGAGKGFKTVFYMTIGSGIGGGIITDGKIYHGRIPGEVEIGHIRLNKSGQTLENQCSGWAVNKKVEEHIQQYPKSLLAKLANNNSSPAAYLLAPALTQNDSAAIKILAEVADDISFALSHIVHLFNPDVIVIGGGLSLLKEHLQLPVAEKLSAYIMKALSPAPSIKIAELSEDVVPIGALELAKNIYKSNFTKNTF